VAPFHLKQLAGDMAVYDVTDDTCLKKKKIK
jgi:hypothetical protein